DRSFDTRHRRIHFVAERKRNQVTGRCAIMAGVKALSAVRQGGTGGIPESAWNTLRTFPGAGRETKTEARLTQHRLAQRLIPRLRRSHGDGGVPERHRAPARPCSRSRADCHHVRGGCLVALPSFADLRLPESAWD